MSTVQPPEPHNPVPLRTIAEIFDALGPLRVAAELIGVKTSAASEMKRRGKISGEYWANLADNAARVGCEWCTIEYLGRCHAAAKGLLPRDASPAHEGGASARIPEGTC